MEIDEQRKKGKMEVEQRRVYLDLSHSDTGRMKSTTVIALVIAVSFFCVASTGNAERPKTERLRRYDQGPLQNKEFRKDAKDAIRGRAKTMAQVMYSYRTRIRQKGTERFEVHLTSLNAFSVFLPNESWWSHRESESLLDHEQGHFDIAEIAARRLELSFRQVLKKGQAISGSGKTLKQANAELTKKLQLVIDVANEQSLEANAEYDRSTLHGGRFGSQTEARRIQKLTLEKLAKQLKGMADSGGKTVKE